MKTVFYLLLFIFTADGFGQQIAAPTQAQLRELARQSDPSVIVSRTEKGTAPIPPPGVVSLPGVGSGVVIPIGGGGFPRLEPLPADATIHQGIPGGSPLIPDGEVVGIVNQILTRPRSLDGLGFAVTINIARKLFFQSSSFWTGLDGYMLTDEMSRIFNLSQPAGLLVLHVASDSPLTDLGLQAGIVEENVGGQELIVGGDIILEISGIAIAPDLSTMPAIEAELSATETGEPFNVKVLRMGQVIELSAAMRAR